MKNTICLSNGIFYKLYKDRNKMLSKLFEFSPDGFEIHFPCPKYIYSFHPLNSEIAKLRKLKFVSIHAPCLDIKWGDNPESQKALQTIEKIYQKIGAQNVVFHENVGDDLSVTKKYNFSASIENDDWCYKLNSVVKVSRALKKYPHLGFTFDLAHVLSIPGADPLEYINQFRDKIIEVHVAWLGKRIADHRFLHCHDSKRIRMIIREIKKLQVPLVIECVAKNKKEIGLIKAETNYLKRI